MKRILLILLALLLLPVSAAAEEAPVEIRTVEDLLAISRDPSGSYILMEDLDMTGADWESPAFSGTFDGNGHAILNVTLTRLSEETVKTYDGNRKEYDTRCAGFFSVLTGAEVKNLRLVNLRGSISSDEPCFLGGMAGYMENSTVSGCEISGCLELRAHDRMFGIGGAVGYGGGTVSGCRLELTLICVDTDAETKDEQFLGGVYGGGYISVTDCHVGLDGWISEHGYVHSGGITGMFMDYPGCPGETGSFLNNHVAGKITFFEDNRDRRAYCQAYIGEILVFTAFYMKGNTAEFEKREVMDYSRELRPESCAAPGYTETVTVGQCDTFGYTTYTCGGCGWSYRDLYTLPVHTVSSWSVEKEPTVEEEGLSRGSCDLCGAAQEKTLPKAEPEPTVTEPPATQPLPTQAPVPQEPPLQERLPVGPLLAVFGSVLAILIAAVLCRPRKNKGKFQK